MQKPLILITNDDGITAPGIQNLIQVVSKFANVVVVAPDSPQSAMGHAITINNTLQLKEISNINDKIKQYSCSGTPADCVKIAINEVLKVKPDLCISGINHGSNASINVIYSGTMSAAIEAAIEGVPAIGFSLADFSWEANFEPILSYVEKIIKQALAQKLAPETVLNVNFPKANFKDIKGIKICRQAKARWHEKFDKRQSPIGKDYYWLTGEFVNLDPKNDTDIWALENNYISIVPVHFDFTAYNELENLKNWKF